MDIKNFIQNLRTFIESQTKTERETVIYNKQENMPKYFKNLGISVEIDGCKEIILQEETALELGGVNKKSFSLIYPIYQLNLINDGKITLIGPEIEKITTSSVDFGIFVLIGFKQISEKDFDNLRQFNFVSNGIEGFMIRTIPRRFWCRLNRNVIKKKISFEFLGNAFIHLYKEKFGELIKSMEVIFINSYPDVIKEFTDLTSDIRKKILEKWQNKIEEWKKRVDCDYDWECQDCPYIETCDEVREVLEERENLKD